MDSGSYTPRGSILIPDELTLHDLAQLGSFTGLLIQLRPAWRGDAQVDGGAVLVAAVDLGDLVFGSGEADAKPLDLAEPALALGFGDAVDALDALDAAVADVDEPCPLGRDRSQE
ncbi:hypothetical protein [Streptomyces chartreusis]|uniref:hypothetical protein n=1 Tax=Streptomyces chartreusis TaxID=1969 RepID=UPI002E82045E|nr:hypothetical protein [Streptomyces chartreusis]WUB18340.1 hypothetical protein OG997_17140 [Streptomyces chartreusis]